MNFKSLDEFWVFYMSQHSKPSTSRWHFTGTAASLVLLISWFIFSWWYVLLVHVVGYGLAWYIRFFPATFGHPVWSLLCVWKMFGFMLTGQMYKEIKRLAKKAVVTNGRADTN